MALLSDTEIKNFDAWFAQFVVAEHAEEMTPRAVARAAWQQASNAKRLSIENLLEVAKSSVAHRPRQVFGETIGKEANEICQWAAAQLLCDLKLAVSNVVRCYDQQAPERIPDEVPFAPPFDDISNAIIGAMGYIAGVSVLTPERMFNRLRLGLAAIIRVDGELKEACVRAQTTALEDKLAEAEEESEGVDDLIHEVASLLHTFGDKFDGRVVSMKDGLLALWNSAADRMASFQSQIESMRSACDEEKKTRVKYQDVIYAACNLADRWQHSPAGDTKPVTVYSLVTVLESLLVRMKAEAPGAAAAGSLVTNDGVPVSLGSTVWVRGHAHSSNRGPISAKLVAVFAEEEHPGFANLPWGLEFQIDAFKTGTRIPALSRWAEIYSTQEAAEAANGPVMLGVVRTEDQSA